MSFINAPQPDLDSTLSQKGHGWRLSSWQLTGESFVPRSDSSLPTVGFPDIPVGKESTPMQVQFLGWGNPLEKGKATHSVFWPGEFHGLYSSLGWQKVGQDWATSLSHCLQHSSFWYNRSKALQQTGKTWKLFHVHSRGMKCSLNKGLTMSEDLRAWLFASGYQWACGEDGSLWKLWYRYLDADGTGFSHIGK